MHAPRTRRRGLAAVAAAAVSLALPATALPAVTGHSGWSWSMPSPQGEHLRDVAFADAGTGYAVGAFGTVLRTDDGGLTWRGLPSGTVEGLERLTLASPSSFTVAGGCAARLSGDGGATLARVAFGAPDLGCATSVLAALAPDATTRYVVQRDGNVLASTDGGVSFTRRTAVPGSSAAGGFEIPVEVIATAPGTLLALSGVSILRSSDGAGSWTTVASPATLSPIAPLAVTILPSGLGYAVGHGGSIARTTDAGRTWSNVPYPLYPLPERLVDVACASPELCLALTETSAVLRTTDGWATTTRVNPSSGKLNALAFTGAGRAVAVGDAGLTVVSDDGGLTWRRVGGGPAGTARGMGAGTGGQAWLWGDLGLVSSSVDGGATWTGGPVPTTRPIVSASYADALTGFALESGGGLWRTANGGRSWQVLDPGPGAERLTGVLALTPRRVLLVGRGGARVSSDGGDTFRTITATAVRRAGGLSSAVRLRGGAALLGPRGAVWSRDGVSGWAAMPLPRVGRRPVRIAAEDCAAGGACWVMSDRRRVWVTTNNGRRWREATAGLPGGIRVAGLVAVGARRAYVVLRRDGFDPALPGGWVLATANGGATWQPQLVGSPALVGGTAGGGGELMLGEGGQVFTTTTGGTAGTPSTLTLRASARVIRRPTAVTVTGRLRPAEGRERVFVSAGAAGRRVVTAASDGRFSAAFRLRATTRVVAHWGGDGVRAGAGSAVLTVRRR